MKITLHIPTEQYGFVAVELEGDSHGIAQEDYAERVYREFARAFAPKPVNEMPELEFSRYIDLIGNGQTIPEDPGILEKMSPKQQYAVNTLKKFIKRCAYKHNK